ncbi:MAG TPA: DnaJ domain-containing protein [Nitrospiria bacterium]|nr:DnaJ domain-containing protein [Nitrospiria bacterium]
MPETPTGAVSPQPDYFAVFGLPRHLSIDAAALEAAYHRLSREVHPDFHLTKPADERERLLARSALVNQAYRTLRDFHARVEYLVELEGGDALKPKAPPELLEDVLEVQDLLEECRAQGRLGTDDPLTGRLSAEAARLQRALAALDAELVERSKAWDAAIGANGAGSPARGEVLARLQGLLSQRVYVVNLLRDINGVRTQGA